MIASMSSLMSWNFIYWIFSESILILLIEEVPDSPDSNLPERFFFKVEILRLDTLLRLEFRCKPDNPDSLDADSRELLKPTALLIICRSDVFVLYLLPPILLLLIMRRDISLWLLYLGRSSELYSPGNNSCWIDGGLKIGLVALFPDFAETDSEMSELFLSLESSSTTSVISRENFLTVKLR